MAKIEYLLKSDEIIFKDILSNGYVIEEDVPRIAKKEIMQDGSILSNYYTGTDTTITIKFARLSPDTFKKYMKILKKDEAIFLYYSLIDKKYKKGRFSIDRPPLYMYYTGGEDEDSQIIEEFEVTLEKIAEVIDE